MQNSVTTTGDNLGESWGMCAIKPRLPGRSFDYTEEELISAATAGLEQLSDCSFPALHMEGNVAKRYISVIAKHICSMLIKALTFWFCILDQYKKGSVEQFSRKHAWTRRNADSVAYHPLLGPAWYSSSRMLQVISRPDNMKWLKVAHIAQHLN